MKKKRVNLWLVLPEELISQIMTSSGLDLKSMIKCMRVCKRWRNLVSDLISTNPLPTNGDGQFLAHYFPLVEFGALDDKTHQIAWTKTLVIESLDDDLRGGSCSPPWGKLDPPRFMSSCNGLVCLVGFYHRDIYICNPMTGECISFTNPTNHWHSNRRYDLGFCSNSNEYKLTAFRSSVVLEIYTLGSPSGWRSIPCNLPNFYTETCAIRVSGVFHWLVETRNILTFDLEKEVFGSIPLPCLEDGKEIYQLECMDQCLVVTAGYNPPSGLEIWMRKEDKSSGESVWTKNWVIDVAAKSLVHGHICYRYLRPRKLSSNGRVFMTHFCTDLYSYDPRDKLVRHHYSGRELYAHYTPTLVSPKKLMKKKNEN